MGDLRQVPCPPYTCFLANKEDRACTQVMRTKLIIRNLEQSLVPQNHSVLLPGQGIARDQFPCPFRACDLAPEVPYPTWNLSLNLHLFTGQEGGKPCVSPAVGLEA